MKQTQFRLLCAAALACTLAACGDDSNKSDASVDGGNNTNDAGPKAGKDAGPKAGKDAGPKAGKDAGGDKLDAGNKLDASTDDGGATDDGGTAAAMYHVPANGGTFHFTTDSGSKITFLFPASAAGKDITLASVDPKSVSWGNSSFKTAFSEVIELGPSGTTFATPIKVTFADGSLFAFDFSDPAGAPDPLQLSSDGKSLLLKHFSSLAVVPPTALCDSVGGWSDVASSQSCSGATSTLRAFDAKCYKFCYYIHVTCCVDPTKTTNMNDGCATGDANLAITENRYGSNGGQYPYCDVGLPTTSAVSGTLTAAGGAQDITLTGTYFDPTGSVIIQGSIVIPTVWHSATSATGTVPASYLTATGSLTGIAYANTLWNATGTCAASAADCDLANRSSPFLTQTIQ